MLQRIRMPSMGATMEEGTIVSWKVQEGDRVRNGQVLFELESDKSTYEYECPCDGLVRRILTQAGETVPVSQPVAIIGEPGEEIPEEWLSQPARQSQAARPEAFPETASGPDPAPGSGPASRPGGPRISPRARKLAEQLGIDPTTLQGTGAGGRIESEDVERAAKSGPQRGPLLPISPIRQHINRAVSQSKQQIPHFYLQTMVDVTGLVAHRSHLKAHGTGVSFNAFFLKAAAEGLKAEPGLQRSYTLEGYRVLEQLTLGLAVETPDGVVIVVVEEVDRSDLETLSGRAQAAVDAARQGRAGELATRSNCLTLSNLGMYRADTFLPIIRPGEAAILGIGTIAERPMVIEGLVAPRRTVPVAICVDHRVADGAVAARFLQAFAGYLEGWNLEPGL